MYCSGRKIITAIGVKALLGFISLLTALEGKCQWSVYNYEERKENSQSLLPSSAELKSGFTFFGTSFALDDDVITTGYEPFARNSSWKLVLKKSTSTSPGFLYFNVYTENINAIVLRVGPGDSTYSEKRYSFSKDGYQVPFELPLDNSPETGDSLFLIATIEMKNPLRPHRFVVGDARKYAKQYEKKPSRGYFFYEVTGKEENRLPDYIRTKFGDAYSLKQEAHFLDFNGSKYNFQWDRCENVSDISRNATLQLIRRIFEKYPYYQEHHLDRRKTLDSVDNVIASLLPFNDKVVLLGKKARGLHDGHFYFKTIDKKDRSVTSPLILKRIGNAVQIVGIRDQRLEGEITLGEKICAINFIPAETFIDSVSDGYFGGLEERRDISISHLLEKPVNSPACVIRLEKDNGDFHEVSLVYDQNFPIPSRFRPEQFGFYRLERNWTYLKINRWDKGDWINFYNLRDSISHSKGIIFDLRGNPGGFENEVVSIASCFLKKPFTYAVEKYSFQGKTYSACTIMKPSRFLDLSRLNVIILVDVKTACASELFTSILKKINGATVIGASKTGSSFSTVYSLQLPENIDLFTNVLSKPFLFNGKSTLEYTGIVPDIMVDLRSYKDLYGYDDKVLGTAKAMIDRSVSHSNY
jgi:Peptidase family S41